MCPGKITCFEETLIRFQNYVNVGRRIKAIMGDTAVLIRYRIIVVIIQSWKKRKLKQDYKDFEGLNISDFLLYM